MQSILKAHAIASLLRAAKEDAQVIANAYNIDGKENSEIANLLFRHIQEKAEQIASLAKSENCYDCNPSALQTAMCQQVEGSNQRVILSPSFIKATQSTGMPNVAGD